MWDSTNIDKAFTLNIHQTILRIYFLSLPLISFLTPFPLFFSLQMFDAYCVLILMPMQQAYIPFALFWWSCYCFWSVSKSSERKKMNKILTHTHMEYENDNNSSSISINNGLGYMKLRYAYETCIFETRNTQLRKTIHSHVIDFRLHNHQQQQQHLEFAINVFG